MFRLLGVVLAAYVALSVLRGRVHARHGVWGASIDRDAAPQRFWLTIAVYGALATALVTVF
jgi:hypothetical protein